MRARDQRRLATVLFVDIVDSTRIAAEVGDAGWRELVRSFRSAVRAQLRRFSGHEVDTAGDGFFAWFERPADALRAAAAIVADVQHLGLDVRCGVHTGELETIDGRLGGIAAHIGARVMAAAGPAEIFVTNTLRELVVGGDIGFEVVGETELKGVPGRWTLHRLAALAQRPSPAPLELADAQQRWAAGAVGARQGRRVPWPALAGLVAVTVVAAYLLRGIGAPGPSASPSPSPTRAGGTAPASASATTSPSPSPSPYPISLVAIDPVTNRLTDEVRDAHASGTRGDLILTDGNLWVYEEEVSVLTRRDITTGEWLASLPLPEQTWMVRIVYGSIWIAHGDPLGMVDRVDPTSFRQTGQIDPGEELWDATIGEDSLYLLTRDSRVLEYDRLLDAQLPRAPIDVDPIGTATDPVYISFRDGVLVLCECGAGREALFDPEADELVGSLEGAAFGLGDAPRDPATGALWVADPEVRTIIPFETAAGPPGRAVGLQGRPRSIAFGFASVWVAAEEWVYRIASGSRDVLPPIAMPEGAKAVSIGVDEATNRVWVSLCYGVCPP